MAEALEEPEDYGPTAVSEGKNAAAVALGLMGGQARAKKLSKNQRSKIAKKAAKSRWQVAWLTNRVKNRIRLLWRRDNP
jgi:hypothetical protein